MKIRIDSQSYARDPETLRRALQMLADDFVYLRGSYPNFDHWFFHQVVPGVMSGERSIFIEQRNTSIAGILILKHTSEEKKLCTLRVRPEYESLGLGVRLFETAFDVLGTEKPLLSVAEDAYPKFARLFDHFNFLQHESYVGKYLPRRTELSFNGVLETGKAHFYQQLRTTTYVGPTKMHQCFARTNEHKSSMPEFA